MKKTLILALILSLLAMMTACGRAASGSFSEEDIALLISGETFTLNDPVESIVEILGEDFDYSEIASDAYEGLDKMYDYGTIIVATVPPEGKDVIAEIHVLGGDLASTAKGIKIGSTLAELEAAYGTDYTLDDDILTYWAGPKNEINTPNLYFVMDGEDKVSEISISNTFNG